MDAYIVNPGVLTCLGENTTFWQRLLKGESGLTEAGDAYNNWFSANTSRIGVIPGLVNNRSRLLQILERIGNSLFPDEIHECELILGASSLGDLQGDFAGDPFACMSHYFATSFPNLASRFKGVVSSACSSGTDVLTVGAMLVDQKKYDVVGLLAVDCLDQGKLLQHFALGTQTPDRARPFDETRNGTSFGEGGGFTFLCNRSGLKRLNAKHIFQVLGYGMSCDAMNITAPDETGKIPSLAIKRALNNANCAPFDIGYVNAHGSGTVLNDYVETLALQQAFGDNLRNIPVSGTKGAIGHLLGATGLVETVISCWAVAENTAPGTTGLTMQDSDLRLSVIGSGETLKLSTPVAMSTTFGFGGVNSSIVVSRNCTD